jgi:hypothetical protein
LVFLEHQQVGKDCIYRRDATGNDHLPILKSVRLGDSFDSVAPVGRGDHRTVNLYPSSILSGDISGANSQFQMILNTRIEGSLLRQRWARNGNRRAWRLLEGRRDQKSGRF